jgi:hypothetical protein
MKEEILSCAELQGRTAHEVWTVLLMCEMGTTPIAGR